MDSNDRVLIVGALLAAILTGGCGSETPTPNPESSFLHEKPVESTTAVPTSQVPGGPQWDLTPPEGSGTGTTGVSWIVPEGWTERDPANAMRKAEYSINGPGGSAELIVYYFGPGQGGGALQNARRWSEQFVQPDGSSTTAATTISDASTESMEIVRVEVTGTYNGGVSIGGRPPPPAEGYMLLGAVASGTDANWFFKLTGPEATVRDQQEEFAALLASLSSGS